MEGGDIATYIVGPVVTFLLGGGAVSVYSAHRSATSQLAGDQREARRDTVADRDAFIVTMLSDMREMRVEMRTLRERMDDVEGISRGRSDHIDILEAHIWAGHAPPPPARPEGI
ncbi:hypothetical protein [Sanguibacter sp. 25GB23B1]|uniref:hypothetical protein n=1 Tax=unclassified Sanguibacter TaxID=2645534 RepID=UPI0032AF858C